MRNTARRCIRRVYGSTTLRVALVRLLKMVGFKQFQARSGINQPFICHLGDFIGEGPFVNAEICRAEIVSMTAWCEQIENPIIWDVGGNCGFVATQLALSLRHKKPHIFSFEPVPYTFQRLVNSIKSLSLEDYVFPVCVGLSNTPGVARISYFESNTMLAQVFESSPNKRVGDKVAVAGVLSLDQMAQDIGEPCLIKIDVEGHETKVLEGAKKILSSKEPPAICFELNPLTLKESDTSVHKLISLFVGYDFFYIDDFEGQRIEFGQKLSDIRKIDWVCNIFAIPANEVAQTRWHIALAHAQEVLSALRNGDFASKAPQRFSLTTP